MLVPFYIRCQHLDQLDVIELRLEVLLSERLQMSMAVKASLIVISVAALDCSSARSFFGSRRQDQLLLYVIFGFQ